MKQFKWTEETAKGGVYVIRNSYDLVKEKLKEGQKISPGYAATVICQIGYVLNPKNEGKYTLNHISDGWVYDNLGKPFTKKQLVDCLNKEGKEGYRPATFTEVMAAQFYLVKNFYNPEVRWDGHTLKLEKI